MPIDRPHARPRRWLALAAVLGLFLAACGNSDDDGDGDASGDTTTTTAGTTNATGAQTKITGVPGVTDTEIRFAALGTNSNNPLGTCVLDCYADGIQAYFEYRNSEGGLDGRKLVLSKKVDDELAQNQVKAKEIVAANDVFAAFSATQVATGWGEFANAGIPLYTWSIHPAEMAGKSSIFGYREVLCTTCTNRAVAYIAQQSGAKVIGSLGYGISENSKQCASGNARSIERYGSQVGGVRVGYTNDSLAFGLPNGVAPEVSAMKRAGVDLVLACIDLNGMKTVAQEMQRQGMGDVTMYHPNTYDQEFVKNAGQLFEGDYVGVQFRPFEANVTGSAAETYQKWMKQTGKDPKEISMVGWINADLAYQGIKAAGPQFDRAKVVAATNGFTEFTAGGLTQPVDWSRGHVPRTDANPGANGPRHDCVALVQVKNGEFELVGDPNAPFNCWPGSTGDWSQPTPMSFK